MQEALKSQEIEIVETKLKENAQASEVLMTAKFEQVSKQNEDAAAAKAEALEKLGKKLDISQLVFISLKLSYIYQINKP